MQQLSALDSAIMNMETGTTPMHLSCLAIYDQSTIPGGDKLRFKEVIQHFTSRIHKIPQLRNRYVSVPFGLDYPYWIADPDFDVEFHLRHIALPEPGDWRQLCIQAARINARPLDMSRPPWEVYIIGGLDNVKSLPKGCFAMLLKVHQSLVDCDASQGLIAALHDLEPTPASQQLPQPWVVDRVPTSLELLARATLNRPKRLVQAGRVIAKYSPAFLKATSRRLFTKKGCSIGMAPHTRFNNKVSPHRVFESAELDLHAFKQLINIAPEFTLSDLVTGVISGGMRRYLKTNDELPEQSLNAMLPLTVKTKKHRIKGNSSTSFICPKLYTNVEDPRERLQLISIASAQGRKSTSALGGKEVEDASLLLPNTIMNMMVRAASRYNAANHVRPLFNTVITNVAGPQIPLYKAGSKLLRFYATGPCWETVGLSHLVYGYNGKLTISITSCREMLPDPAFYVECLEESFREIQQALGSPHASFSLAERETESNDNAVETADA